MSSCATNHVTPEAIYPFDARGVAKRFRHAAIFGALEQVFACGRTAFDRAGGTDAVGCH